MARDIVYVGTSDVRVIRSSDFALVGITHAEVTFNKANDWQVTVNDDAAAFLLSLPAEFEDAEGALFVDLLGSTGQEIAFADMGGIGNTFLITDHVNWIDVPGLQISPVYGVVPVMIEFQALLQLARATAVAGDMSFQCRVVDELGEFYGMAMIRANLGSSLFISSFCSRRTVFPPGTVKTFKVQGKVTNANSQGIVWSDENPVGTAIYGQTAWLRAVGV